MNELNNKDKYILNLLRENLVNIGLLKGAIAREELDGINGRVFYNEGRLSKRPAFYCNTLSPEQYQELKEWLNDEKMKR